MCSSDLDPPVAASLDSRRSQLHDRDVYSETVLSEQRTLWRSVGGSAAIIPADGCVDLIVRSGQVLLCGPQTLPDSYTLYVAAALHRISQVHGE